MIRLAQVVRPASGGIRRHVTSILSRIDRSEFAPTLFAPCGYQADPSIQGVPIVTVAITARTSPLSDLRVIVGMSRQLRGRFDLVHAHGIRGALIGLPAAYLAGIPALFTAHNMLPHTGWASRSVLRALCRGANVVAVSQAVASSLAASGIDRRRISIVPNGVDMAAFVGPVLCGPERRAALADLIHSAEWTTSPDLASWLRDEDNAKLPVMSVGAIGRLAHEKGFDTLIQAFEYWLSNRGGSSTFRRLLILAGTGPDEALLRRLARNIPDVSLLGEVADAVPLFRSVDIAVAPSRQEGHGIAALEAMAAGRAVIASRVGGLVESIRDGESGILVPPGDPAALSAAMESLAESPATRTRFGTLARARVEEYYSLERMIERLASIYRGAVSGRRSRAFDASTR